MISITVLLQTPGRSQMAKTSDKAPPSDETTFINRAAACLRLYLERHPDDTKARLAQDVLHQHSLFRAELLQEEMEHVGADFYDDETTG